jgi:hypothetical protein
LLTIVASPGTNSSINRGELCQSDYATGRINDSFCKLVLRGLGIIRVHLGGGIGGFLGDQIVDFPWRYRSCCGDVAALPSYQTAVNWPDETGGGYEEVGLTTKR